MDMDDLIDVILSLKNLIGEDIQIILPKEQYESLYREVDKMKRKASADGICETYGVPPSFVFCDIIFTNEDKSERRPAVRTVDTKVSRSQVGLIRQTEITTVIEEIL